MYVNYKTYVLCAAERPNTTGIGLGYINIWDVFNTFPWLYIFTQKKQNVFKGAFTLG